MSLTPAHTQRGHVYAIRNQMLRDAGHPAELDPDLGAKIAAELRRRLDVVGVKAFRLAYGWTVAEAIERFHAMCTREDLGVRGLVDRSWKEWEAGHRPSDDYRDLLCRLFQTGPTQLGFGRDYTPGPAARTELQPSGMVAEGTDQWREMHRRSFLGTPAALVLGWQLGDIDAGWVAPPNAGPAA